MRLANLRGRATLVVGEGLVDVEERSGRRFSADPMAAMRDWAPLADWARGLRAGDATAVLRTEELGPPVPRPAKVFAIGVNYRAHVAEAGMELPKTPMVFTKFPSCLAGPSADVVLSSAFVDWEVELVVVVGRGGWHIPEERALEHVAGYCVGQDISDRRLQFSDKPPQFCLGKSLDGFGPTGPAVVSLDEFADPNDLALTCDVAGERMQDARTSDMIFGVPTLVAYLARHCTLEPGDLIFTGTPSGVGSTRNPRRYLRADEEIVSTIERIGTLRNRCVSEAVER
ncbi:MAG: fumarylacetoacetate hydrolase family protein [Deltaproteobacteria bacterium]|nr:MAG: fumarylacetoacetate hydrolase family protein [Deltaproteobacteria bacterium]TMA95220.1 MAG: fumarylacetoacetate hydrolase family protein [Deltaproteobacteria bacterium]